MLGIESRKECVVAIAIIKTANVIGVVWFSKMGDALNNRIHTKLIWMPGIRPVKIPKSMPNKIAINISMNIIY